MKKKKKKKKKKKRSNAKNKKTHYSQSVDPLGAKLLTRLRLSLDSI